MIKLLAIGFGVFLISGIVLELILRVGLGLGNPLLYVADDQIGYLLAPNQVVWRRGNRIAINHYSMRSEAIALERSPSTLRLLLLGDSIANGGWWTPQTQTISALSQKQLTSWGRANGFTSIEVLNASANSWGPRNELAYLQQFGTFDAQMVILLINTDDLFATAPTPLKVGLDPNYPVRRPVLAVSELSRRYFPSPTITAALQTLNDEEGDRVGYNLTAIHQIAAQATQNHSQFLLAHTPLLRELGTPGPRDYELTARQRLTKLVQNNGWTYLDFLAEFNGTELKEADEAKNLYWDHIHLNVAGNQVVVEAIAKQAMILLAPDSKIL